MTAGDLFRRIITALDQAGIPHMLTGSFASAYYADRDAALAALESEGQFNVIDLASGWKIDLMIRKARPFSREEFTRRRPAWISAGWSVGYRHLVLTAMMDA